DNEPSLADLEALPPSEVTGAVIDAIVSGAFEIYVPPWFADIVAGKFQDPRAFLEGSAAWTAPRVATLGRECGSGSSRPPCPCSPAPAGPGRALPTSTRPPPPPKRAPAPATPTSPAAATAPHR